MSQIIDFNDYCLWCEAQLTIDKCSTYRQYCSRDCREAHYRCFDKQARLEAKKDRPPCPICGTEITPERFKQTIFCSPECWNADYSAIERAARLEAKINRPPCRTCGKAIPPEAFGQKVYCSDLCRFRARKPRHHGNCERCGAGFSSHNPVNRFCSRRCHIQSNIRKYPPKPCAWCGLLIPVLRRSTRKYCCKTCASRGREARLTPARFDRIFEGRKPKRPYRQRLTPARFDRVWG